MRRRLPFCKFGHALDGDNVKAGDRKRRCQICEKEYQRQYGKRNLKKKNEQQRKRYWSDPERYREKNRRLARVWLKTPKGREAYQRAKARLRVWRKDSHAGQLASIRGGVLKMKAADVPREFLEMYLTYRKLKQEIRKREHE
jgi:hypothetical protein